jgi:cellulose synthase/poly-beta-1,6-N-acetylglucosamine synthase-like glycosyltransferase
MPEISPVEKYFAFWKKLFSEIRDIAWETIGMIFAVTTGLCVIRILFMSFFVMRSNRMEEQYASHDFQPPTTILVPAYNEDKVIERTIL